jgi:hypothetical protein
MYNDQLKVANKIISSEDLIEIFSAMQEKLNYYKKIYANEEMKNRIIDYQYQNWTFKDCDSKLVFTVDFYDNSSIKFDNYFSFSSVFNNRLEEIKSINLFFSLNYNIKNETRNYEYYNQHIGMNIYEDKMSIDVSLSSNDNKLNDIYDLIKNKILNAPLKYDDVIKNKNKIITIVGSTISFIPALIICLLLLIVPSIRVLCAGIYIVFPLCTLILTFTLGEMIGQTKIGELYENIIPEKKYVGYDSKNYNSIYKDDIDKYLSTSEILIGKNVDNLKNRKLIIKNYNKYKKYILYELGVLIITSIIVLFLG